MICLSLETISPFWSLVRPSLETLASLNESFGKTIFMTSFYSFIVFLFFMISLWTLSFLYFCSRTLSNLIWSSILSRVISSYLCGLIQMRLASASMISKGKHFFISASVMQEWTTSECSRNVSWYFVIRQVPYGRSDLPDLLVFLDGAIEVAHMDCISVWTSDTHVFPAISDFWSKSWLSDPFFKSAIYPD